VLRFHFEHQAENDQQSAAMRLFLPGPCELLPRQKRWVTVAAIAMEEGPLLSKIRIVSKEVTLVVPVKGGLLCNRSKII
jgi:hypothetical protein